jgi:hypothetical protein
MKINPGCLSWIGLVFAWVKQNSKLMAKEESKTVGDLVNQGKDLMGRVMVSMREMFGSMEQKWFQGDRSKMVASMVAGMMIILGMFLYLVFSKDE